MTFPDTIHDVLVDMLETLFERTDVNTLKEYRDDILELICQGYKVINKIDRREFCSQTTEGGPLKYWDTSMFEFQAQDWYDDLMDGKLEEEDPESSS